MEIIVSGEKLPNINLLNKLNWAGKESLLMHKLPEEAFELSLNFVSSDKIKELNFKYMKKDKVTDVLSFPQYASISEIEEEFEESDETEYDINDNILLGDIIICLEKAKEQAEEYNQSLEEEIAYLFIHGFLHLLGYDHIDKNEKKKMRKVEEEIREVISSEAFLLENFV
ncbi:MAG: rRNA maturation RNase YbeY [Anaerovoracaceae bacterium]